MSTDQAVEGYPISLVPVRQWRRGIFKMTLRLVTPTGVKVNLGGYGPSWAATARRKPGAAVGFDMTVDPTFISDPDDPRLIISLTDAQTLDMAADSYGFDVFATGGAQSPFPVWRGLLLMDGPYTNA